MDQMSKTAQLDMDSEWHLKLRQEFRSTRITDEEMCDAMSVFHQLYGYLLDPHTAIAVKGAEKLGYFSKDSAATSTNFVILATASPCKFQEAITVALGHDAWEHYESNLPNRVKAIISAEEIEPYQYQNDGRDLRIIQKDWMNQALDIIQRF
jgi:threonine synthase